jgi:DNA-binding CsgD family transcriptional regulator/tetratricopeptide (TPR) repeat protein
VLIGRERELAHLTALVDAARHGSAGSVVLRGEPGVGKSALLAELVDASHLATVLRTRGLEAEAPLAFAALHRLLRPVERLRDGLPAPQARALRVAFGEEDGPSVEPFLVGIATLTVLTSAAEENLVVCVIDDAHWLDPASAGALLFCSGRLGADRVAMVYAARDGAAATFEAPGVPERTLTGLGPEAARTLLGAHLEGVPVEDVTRRLIAETGGNPLALLELPTELTADQLLGQSPLPAQLHLTTRVEQVFLDRSRRLSADVQTMLLLAAADDTGEVTVLRRAAGSLGLDENALGAAVGSGLLVEDGPVVAVRHPLVRSAIYQAATGESRRRVHRALAEAMSGRGDPDRQTWHRAAAADGPDDELVAALELVGSRAQRRGGHAAALAAFERAAGLATRPERGARLLLAGAWSAWAIGQAARCQTLIAAARDRATDPALRWDIARLRGHVEVNIGSAIKAHRIFVEAAVSAHEVDPVRALDNAVAAALIRTYGADSGTPLPMADDLARPAVGDSPQTLCLKQLLTTATHVAEGSWSAARDALDLALRTGEQVDDRDVLWNLGNASLQLGDDDAQQRFYGYALARAREAGAVTAVVYCLQRLCFCSYLAGDLGAARSLAEEAVSLAEGIGQPALTALPVGFLTLLAAIQGKDEYDALLLRLEDLATTYPLGILTDPVHDLTRWAKGAKASAAGDNAGAVHHLSRFRLPVFARMSAPERIESAVRADEIDLARSVAEELAPFAEATGRPWALATVAFGRALTARPGDAESSFQEALAQHALARRPLDAARTELAYGEWLRRTQRRVDARQHLRRALETFDDVSAEALADRANQELRASGETARKRDPSTVVKLTPMELKIAQLVSSGLSNKDVAAQCWISPRTVAFHLRNVFAKAGVTSRGALAQLELG